MVGLRLPPPLEQRLNSLVAQTHRSKSFYLKQALENFLDEYEEVLLAETISERIVQGKEKTYSLEEVSRFLNEPKHKKVDH